MPGRRRFQTAELMQQAVDAYFAKMEEEDKRPTLSGLALEMGFSTLGSLRQYQGYEDQDYKWVLDTAKLRCQEHVEARGRTGFDAFLLKNYDPEQWKDKTEQDVTERRQLEKGEKLAILSQLKARMQEKQLNAIPGEAKVVEPEDDSWIE